MVTDTSDKTELGNYFVSNYPPFSVWGEQHVPAAEEALARPPRPDTPLGLYMHIPFCRKRCHFCYFRVYTDKNARDVDTYIDSLAKEVALYADQPGIDGRQFEFVYFGGGTPSFLSADQLKRLIGRIGEHWTWESAREVTFECEPGTLKKHKLEAIREIGVTRLSLGVEHFDDEILAANNRAHKSPEVHRAYEWVREVGFDQVNIDLIAGMVGETEDNWKYAVEEALKLEPDSVTVYQMELPFNTTISRETLAGGAGETPIADWATKRRWADYAFRQFEAQGYVVSSAYTVVKPGPHAGFVYRDANWRGADMVGTGVASFSHFQGVHYQNEPDWEQYVARTQAGELPIKRALPISDYQRLIRETILQMKLGRLDRGYFRDKFGQDVVETFSEAFESLVDDGWVSIDGDAIRVSRDGLLRVDSLLERFFEPEHRNIRYT